MFWYVSFLLFCAVSLASARREKPRFKSSLIKRTKLIDEDRDESCASRVSSSIEKSLKSKISGIKKTIGELSKLCTPSVKKFSAAVTDQSRSCKRARISKGKRLPVKSKQSTEKRGLPPGFIKNYHPLRSGKSPEEYAVMLENILSKAQTQKEMSYLDYLRSYFFPGCDLIEIYFLRDARFIQLKCKLERPFFAGDLLVKGIVKGTRSVPCNIEAPSAGVFLQLNGGGPGTVYSSRTPVLRALVFNHSLSSVYKSTAMPRFPMQFGSFSYDGSRLKYRGRRNPPTNYHCPPLSLRMHRQLLRDLIQVEPFEEFRKNFPSLESYFPGHVILIYRSTIDEEMAIAKYGVSAADTFKKDHTLVTFIDGQANYVNMKASFEGVLLEWMHPVGTKINRGQCLGRIIYFHPERPAYGAKKDFSWFESSRNIGKRPQKTEKKGEVARVEKDIVDLSDPIFDSEKQPSKNKTTKFAKPKAKGNKIYKSKQKTKNLFS